ncbi:lipase [Mycobacteroides abscessus subsp. abscessus]|nr:lipase [Mycobacteroides abscessus subsp. abscessus]
MFAGDSAGGYLTFATALRALECGLPAPAGLVGLSPLLDLDYAAKRDYVNVARDPYIPLSGGAPRRGRGAEFGGVVAWPGARVHEHRPRAAGEPGRTRPGRTFRPRAAGGFPAGSDGLIRSVGRVEEPRPGTPGRGSLIFRGACRECPFRGDFCPPYPPGVFPGRKFAIISAGKLFRPERSRNGRKPRPERAGSSENVPEITWPGARTAG